MVQIGRTLIFDQLMLSTLERTDEMAPKSVLRFICTEMFYRKNIRSFFYEH